MAAKIKIAVVANCQARPIAQILPLLNPDIEVTVIAIVHLLKNDDESQYENIFKDSDYIIAQLVSDNYPCEFVRQSNLVEKYGDKVISIINLFFSGYTPDLRYIRIPGQGTLRGPLGDYHNQTLFQAWREGLSVESAIQNYLSVDFNKEKYSSVSDASIGELKAREANSYVKIVDKLEEELSNSRLFFSFNHPAMELLEALVRSLLEETGISNNMPKKLLGLKETLDQFIPPVNCFSEIQLQIDFVNPQVFKGVDCVCDENGLVVIGKGRTYKLEQIVKIYFDIYEKNSKLIDEKKIQ